MKKISVLALGLLASVTVSAQTALVKDSEKAFKAANSYGAYEKALEAITPAFSNEETKGDAATYWIPGKAGFKLYDEMYQQALIGKNPDAVQMGSALLAGLKYGMQALAVDTVVDAKGKVKTKYSKEITSTISGHHNDFLNNGSAFWDAQKYPEAYEAFMAYVTLPDNPSLGVLAPKAGPDSLQAQIAYYAGLSAWQGNMLPEAAAAFEKMMKIGYNDIAAYDYAYSVAYAMNDEQKKLEYSKIAYDKFGNEKPEFLQRIISYYMGAKDYDTATKILQDGIAADPNNGNYYYLLGVLYDDKNDKEASKANFKKAVELSPDNALVNFSYGTALVQEYERLDEQTGNMSQAEYNKYRFEVMNPILKESTTYLEKAYELDNDLNQALQNLKIVYYNLNDAANLDRVEKLLL